MKLTKTRRTISWTASKVTHALKAKRSLIWSRSTGLCPLGLKTAKKLFKKQTNRLGINASPKEMIKLCRLGKRLPIKKVKKRISSKIKICSQGSNANYHRECKPKVSSLKNQLSFKKFKSVEIQISMMIWFWKKMDLLLAAVKGILKFARSSKKSLKPHLSLSNLKLQLTSKSKRFRRTTLPPKNKKRTWRLQGSKNHYSRG